MTTTTLDLDKLLSPEEVGVLLDEKPKTIIERARRGEMACFRYGRRIKFTPQHVADYLAQHETGPQMPKAGRKPSVSTRSASQLAKSA